MSKLCAICLVTLILLPFSAPFSTYEFSTETPFASLGDAGTTHVLPVRTTQQVRFGLTLVHDSAGRAVSSPMPAGYPARLLNIGAPPPVTPLRI